MFRGSVAEVERTILPLRSAIIDPNDHETAGAEISDPQQCTEGQTSVRSGEGEHIELLTIGGGPAMMPLAVPTGLVEPRPDKGVLRNDVRRSDR